MLRLIFEGAIALHPEMHSATARAIYGVDVLLTSDFEPKLLEVETTMFRVFLHIHTYINHGVNKQYILFTWFRLLTVRTVLGHANMMSKMCLEMVN